MTLEGVVFRVVKQDPAQVRLVWKGGDERPMRTFARVQAELSRNGMKATFLRNGGIFEPGGIPSGLLVEDRKLVQPVNPDGPVESNRYGAVFVVTEKVGSENS